MADKKISALTAVADSEIGADDLLHIVDNPGGTPVNKKMTIGQLFENIPTHLAVDDITTLTATASNLSSSFATAIDGSGFSGSVTFTLDDGTDTGQLKAIWMKDRGSYDAVVNVTSSYESHLSSITFNTQGDACILMWDGSGWFVLSNYGATVA